MAAGNRRSSGDDPLRSLDFIIEIAHARPCPGRRRAGAESEDRRQKSVPYASILIARDCVLPPKSATTSDRHARKLRLRIARLLRSPICQDEPEVCPVNDAVAIQVSTASETVAGGRRGNLDPVSGGTKCNGIQIWTSQGGKVVRKVNHPVFKTSVTPQSYLPFFQSRHGARRHPNHGRRVLHRRRRDSPGCHRRGLDPGIRLAVDAGELLGERK